MPVLHIEPNREPTATFVRPTVGYAEGSPSALGSPFRVAEQNREEYYRATHLQTIEFEIARLIVDQLAGAGADAQDRRRRGLGLPSCRTNRKARRRGCRSRIGISRWAPRLKSISRLRVRAMRR